MPFVIAQHSGSAGALLCCHLWCHDLCCECPLVHFVALSRMQGDAMAIGSLSPAAIYLYWIIFPLFVLLRPPVSRLVAVLWLRLVNHLNTLSLHVVRRLRLSICSSTELTHSRTHTLTITYNCCYDEMKEAQDLKIYSHVSDSHSLTSCHHALQQPSEHA